MYRQRIPHQGSGFSASPVAADGKIYLPSEDGDVYVIKAGAKPEVLAHNTMGEVIMASPAISDGMLFLRTMQHVYGVAVPK